jgi:putative transposase
LIATLLKETRAKINLVAGISEIDGLKVFYTDFAKIVHRRGPAKAEMMAVVDHTSKLVWDTPWEKRIIRSWPWRPSARQKKILRRYGRETEGLVVHDDQDSVFLGHGWLYELVVRDKVRVSYSENGPKAMSTWRRLTPDSKQRIDCYFGNRKTWPH